LSPLQPGRSAPRSGPARLLAAVALCVLGLAAALLLQVVSRAAAPVVALLVLVLLVRALLPLRPSR
jgi:hypothetical protein